MGVVTGDARRGADQADRRAQAHPDDGHERPLPGGDAAQGRILDTPVPLLEIIAADADALAAHLAANDPPIACGLGRRHEGVLLFSPVSLTIEQAAIIGRRLRRS